MPERTTTFRCYDQTHYLCVELDGRLVANRGREGPWETFTVVTVAPGVVALRSAHGKFVTALSEAVCRDRGLPLWSVEASATDIGPWEQWTVVQGPDGVGLLSHWGRFLVAEGGGGGEVLADRQYRTPGPWESFQAPGLTATPGPGPLPDDLFDRKITEQLRCDGESFFSGTKTALPVGVHAGDLLGQWAVLPGKRDEILRALDSMYAAGYSFLRCWANIPPNPWWSNKPAPAWGIFETSGFEQKYQAFVAELRQRGLKLHLCPGGLDRYDRDQRYTFYRWITEQVVASPKDYCLVEGVNESEATGAGHLRDELERVFIKPLVDRTGVLGALSATGGTEDRETLRAWTPNWMRFCYYHSYRGGHLHDKYRHHFSFVREDVVRRLAWSGEPTGPGRYVSVTENQHELNDPSATGMLHVQTAMCRTLPCYMSSPGVIFDTAFASMPGFATTPTAVARLPRDVHRFALTHGGTGQAWVGAVGNGDSLVRVDQAFNHDGRFCCTAYSFGARSADLPTGGRSFEGTWYNGQGAPIADQRPGARFHAPETRPGCYFVGRRV